MFVLLEWNVHIIYIYILIYMLIRYRPLPVCMFRGCVHVYIRHIRRVYVSALQDISECLSFWPEHKAVSDLLSVVAEPFCILWGSATTSKHSCQNLLLR